MTNTQKVNIPHERYEELKRNPLLFLRLYEYVKYDNNGHKQDLSKWESIDRGLGVMFDAGDFADRSFGYCLTTVEEVREIEGGKKPDDCSREAICVYVKNITGSKTTDWIAVFNSLIIKSQNPISNKYAFLELIWALDKLSWNATTVRNSIKSYPEETRFFITTCLSKVGRCLSLEKQNLLKDVCESVGGRYTVYIPKTISDFYKNKSYDLSKNLFQLVDDIIEDRFNTKAIDVLEGNNQLAAIHQWLHSNNPLADYQMLTQPIFAIVSEETRLNIIKRYFHDIRNKHTGLDLTILSQFKDNRYDEFIRYRYCIESPAEPVILTVPLLCDSLITLYNTKGQSFQSFEGVLDFAIMHCDPNNPGIDFKLDRIIPTCEDGAVFNNQFKGFVDYSIIAVIDENLMTEEKLKSAFRRILDTCGDRIKYYACRNASNSPISSEILQNCLSNIGKAIKECVRVQPYDNKWKIGGENMPFINKFMKSPVDKVEKDNEYDIDWEMISMSLFRNYILSLPNKFEMISDQEFIIPSYSKKEQTLELYLIESFGKKVRMRIIPQSQSLVGLQFDVFGIKKQIFDELPSEDRYNDNSEIFKAAMWKYQQEEAIEVYRRTVASLQEEIGVPITSAGFFEVPFDRSLLYKIYRKYYCKSTIQDDDRLCEKEFLRKPTIQGFQPFCAPQLAETKNSAINLPFFWCRGRECFHNNLANQIIEKQDDWMGYSLYHMIEIMGYPMLRETEAGYEPTEIIRQYIAISNKVIQKFRRLKCCSCGHLLFSARTVGFNRYNYYSCANPVCTEYRKPVYLNFCFHCKSGLIDSRDSKQCPNGWYICPSCLACCDDAQYERLAQRYVIDNRVVPVRIREKIGKGHNDKGIYYCPNCGNQIQNVDDEHGGSFRGCIHCHINFDEDRNLVDF